MSVYAVGESVVPVKIQLDPQCRKIDDARDTISQLQVKNFRVGTKTQSHRTLLLNIREVAQQIGIHVAKLMELLATELHVNCLGGSELNGKISIPVIGNAMRRVLSSNIVCSVCRRSRFRTCTCTAEPTKNPTSPQCHCTTEPTCSIMTEGTSKSCCWCADQRSADEIADPDVYVDGIGYVRPIQYMIAWPQSIDYCPTCKVPGVSTADLYERLRKLLEPGDQ